MLLVELLSILWLSVFTLAAYGPSYASCPAKYVRTGSVVSPEESAWLDAKLLITNTKLIKFLENANMEDFDPEAFVQLSNRPIRIGLAYSGGGYRAMLVGAGQFAAYDERTRATSNPLAGLLQASTYISSLSGGAWMVGSLAANNFPSIDNVLVTKKLWDLNRNIFDIHGIANIIGNGLYIVNVGLDITSKMLSGLPVTLTDIWGRLLSYVLLPNQPMYGNSFTMSDIQKQSLFANHEMPFPIMVATSRQPRSYVVDTDSIQFEMNVFEFGSYDPRLASYAKQKHLGTLASNGRPTKALLLFFSACRSGFDNVGFEMAMSSSVFNFLFRSFSTSSLPPIISQLVQTFIVNPTTDIPVDVGRVPNPFMKLPKAPAVVAANTSIYLCDGGFDGQNVPLAPLLQKERGIDVIFANDNSDDANQWPDGLSLISTFKNQFTKKGSKSSFPPVPSKNTFINGNLTSRPTFFGCYARDLEGRVAGNPLDTPLVIYLANRPFSYFTNTSTLKLAYTNEERAGMIRNGYEVATRLNGTLDKEWAACVGCAIIQRESERQRLEQSPQCKRCFERYCWDGKEYEGKARGGNFGDESRTFSDAQYGAELGGLEQTYELQGEALPKINDDINQNFANGTRKMLMYY